MPGIRDAGHLCLNVEYEVRAVLGPEYGPRPPELEVLFPRGGKGSLCTVRSVQLLATSIDSELTSVTL